MSRHTVDFNDVTEAKLASIKQKEGIGSLKETLVSCVNFRFSKLFPDYTTVARQAMGMGGGAPAEKKDPAALARARVLMREEEKKAEQDMKDQKKADICVKLLYGKVEDTTDGKICVFQTHDRERSYTQRMPLSQASPVIAENSLFLPSKEVVLRLRPKLKKIYGDK